MTTQSRTNTQLAGSVSKNAVNLQSTRLLSKTRHALKLFRSFLKLENKTYIPQAYWDCASPCATATYAGGKKHCRDEPLQYISSDIFQLLVLLGFICMHEWFFCVGDVSNIFWYRKSYNVRCKKVILEVTLHSMTFIQPLAIIFTLKTKHAASWKWHEI